MMDVQHCLNASNLFNMQRGSACATKLFLCQVFILISQIARFLLQSAWQTPPDFQISRVHLTAICSSLQQCTGQDHLCPKYFFPQISDFKVTNIFIFFKIQDTPFKENSKHSIASFCISNSLCIFRIVYSNAIKILCTLRKQIF